MQVVLGIGEVRGMFERLIRREDEREEVAQFASQLLHKLDAGELTFLNRSESPRIRRALLFLSQADLMQDAHHYLFTLQDFITERDKQGL